MNHFRSRAAARLLSGLAGLLLAATALTAHAAEPVAIFILHSYSQEYRWTQGQHGGFMNALRADQIRSYDVKTEYLDTKRATYTPAYAAQVAGHLREKYRGYRPAAIYVTDDNALNFALDHLDAIFPGVPLFFSGVNDYGVRARLDPGRATGVFEKKEIAPNLALMRTLASGAGGIAIVGDASNTYRAIEHEVRAELRDQPGITARFVAAGRLDALLDQLRTAPARFVFLTTLGAATGADGRTLTLRETIDAIVKSGDRVVFSMEDAYLYPGVLGGYVTSGPRQGRAAAALLQRHLAGTPLRDIAPLETSPNEYIIDDLELQRSGLTIPAAIAGQVTHINVQPGFYDKHRQLVLATLYALIGITVLGLAVALNIYARKNRQILAGIEARRRTEAILADRNAQLDAIFQLSPDGLVSFGGDGRVKYANPAFFRLTGLLETEIVGQPLASLEQRLRAQAENAEHWPGLAACFEEEKVGAGGTATAPYVCHLLELRRPRTVVLNIIGIDSHSASIGRLLYVRDATHQVEVDRMKSEFLSHAAHELRTPMASIYGFTELLIHQEFDEATRKDLLTTIHKQTAWLVDIINELLNLARIEARRGKDIHIEAVPLASLVAETLFVLQRDAARWPLAVDVPDTLPLVRTDASKLRQALTNVLGNAIKYSPAGGTIAIRGTDRIQGERHYVGLAITDCGIGMTPEQARHLGERFWRADTSGNIPGTGLGMAIVKEILDLLDGSFTVESTPGTGTTVTLLLPATDAGRLEPVVAGTI